MTIRRGEPWGEPAQSPDLLRVVPSDAAAREWVIALVDTDRTLHPVGLGGGDMARTLGGGAPGRFPGVVTKAPIDLLRITAGSATTWAVSHVVGRRSWLRGDVVFAMNAQFLGPFDVAPRSHPNDGKVDTLSVNAAMGWRERLQAKGRARTGTHVQPRQAWHLFDPAVLQWHAQGPLDEKFVTERAYENPKFVEDLVRDIAMRLNQDDRIVDYTLEAENFESIHNHSAYALIEKDKTQG